MNLINHDLQPSEEQLYQQIVTTLSSQLSWSHLIELIKIEDAPQGSASGEVTPGDRSGTSQDWILGNTPMNKLSSFASSILLLTGEKHDH
jgi:hypothetical protein